MSNLEQSIAEWRRQMTAAGIKSPVPLDELETHLREETDRQIRAGLSVERAFILAVERIGQGDKLREEFCKVEDAVKRRRKELLLPWAMKGAVILAYGMMGWLWFVGGRSATLEASDTDMALALSSISPFLLLAWAARPLAKILPVSHVSEFKLLVILYPPMFLAAALFRIFWAEIFPVDMVHIIIVLFWALSLGMGFFICLIRWLERCEAIRKDSLKYV